MDGTGSFGTIVKGVFHVDDDLDDERGSWCITDTDILFDITCDPRQDAVYEVSTQTDGSDPAEPWFPIEFVFSCGLQDGAIDFRIALGMEGVGFFDDSEWLDVSGEDQVVVMQTYDTQHIYRVEKDDQEVRLYIDNEDDPSLTVDLADMPAPDIENQNRADLAITSTPGKSIFDLYHFRYRIGTTSFDNGSPDCAADFDDNGDVGISDLLQLLAAWGPCPDPPAACDEDIDEDGDVGLSDLLILLASWGPCP